jgi:hypothetical protein
LAFSNEAILFCQQISTLCPYVKIAALVHKCTQAFITACSDLPEFCITPSQADNACHSAHYYLVAVVNFTIVASIANAYLASRMRQSFSPSPHSVAHFKNIFCLEVLRLSVTATFNDFD